MQFRSGRSKLLQQFNNIPYSLYPVRLARLPLHLVLQHHRSAHKPEALSDPVDQVSLNGGVKRRFPSREEYKGRRRIVHLGHVLHPDLPAERHGRVSKGIALQERIQLPRSDPGTPRLEDLINQRDQLGTRWPVAAETNTMGA